VLLLPPPVSAKDCGTGDDLTVKVTKSETGQCPRTETYTYSASDAAQNSRTSAFSVVVGDYTPPVFDTPLPADVTLECPFTLPAVTVTATDNCGGTPTVVQTSPDSPLGVGAYERTWTATDSCGLTATHTQTITILDTTPPALHQKPANASGTSCAAVPPISPSATDMCGAFTLAQSSTTTGGDCPCRFSVESTWTVTDAAGLTAGHTQTFSVDDTTPPEFSSLPGPITKEWDGADGIPTVTATDSNDGALSVVFSEIKVNGPSPHTYTLTRSWFAEDACGNPSSHTQVLTVVDETPPPFPPPKPNATLNCGANLDDVIASDRALYESKLVEEDISGVLSVYQGEKIDGSCPGYYHIVVTWVLTTSPDSVTNQTHTQWFFFEDNSAPTWDQSAPTPQLTESCDDIPPMQVQTASDDCGGDVTVVSEEKRTDGADPTDYNTYSLTRTWSAVDACGNTAAPRTQTVQVRDGAEPTFTLPTPAALVFECDETVEVLTVTGADNCDGNPTLTPSETTSPTCTDGYVKTYTWSLVDVSGNTNTTSQSVTVVDTTPPTFTGVPDDTSATCKSIPTLASLTASDNCATGLEVDNSTKKVNELCSNDYQLIYTWATQDGCQNTISDHQTITVSGVDPVLTIQPLSGSCAAVPAQGLGVSGADGCSDESITPSFVSEVKTSEQCAGTFTLERTFSVTDACARSVSGTQTVTITDTVAPTLHNLPSSTAVTAECTAPPAPAVSASDACGVGVKVDFSESSTQTDDSLPYTLTRTWSATDGCNPVSFTQIIVVGDQNAPTVMGVFTPLEGECQAPAAQTVQAQDNCATGLLTQHSEQVNPGSCANQFTVVRSWSTKDGAGNPGTASRTISVNDTLAPSFNAVVPTLIQLQCENVVAPAELTASDECDGPVKVSFSEVKGAGSTSVLYSLTRTWSAADTCGNAVSTQQNVEVMDNNNPTWSSSAPQSSTVQCQSEIPVAPTQNAQDQCDDAPSVQMSEVVPLSFCAGVVTRTWTLKDASGNSGAQRTQSIVVADITGPTLSPVEASVTFDCTDTVVYPTVTATDNCDGPSSVSNSSVDLSDTAEGVASVTVWTWTAVDTCGNDAEVKQTITIVDTHAPVADVPESKTTECGSGYDFGILTATSTCDQNPTITHSDSTFPGACDASFDAVRTWHVLAGADNTETFAQTIQVRDTSPPALSGLQNQVTAVTEECDLATTPPTVSAHDLCQGTVSVELTIESSPLDKGTLYIRQWSTEDACGNPASFTQSVSVVDTTPPTVDPAPAPVTVECDQVSPQTALQFSDNCDPSASATQVESRTNGACSSNYSLARSWTVVDNYANPTTVSTEVTVVDTTAPTLSLKPADATLECGQTIPLPVVEASDNCDQGAQLGISAVQNDLTAGCQFDVVQTWRALDACGNSVEHSRTVRVNDTVAPTLVGVPAAVTVECDGIPEAATVTATDGCADNLVVVFTEETAPGHCDGYHTIIRSWSATDLCGNTRTESQAVYVRDTVAPAITLLPPSPREFEYNAVPSISSDLATQVAAVDACGAPVNVVITETRNGYTADSCDNDYEVVRTVTAMDDCGNKNEATYTITVKDTTPPEFNDEPADETVECDGIPPPCVVTVVGADSCGVTVLHSADTSNPNKVVHTWAATDASQNTHEYRQTITVQDTTKPVFSRTPADISVECTCEKLPAAPKIYAMDNCESGDLQVSLQETRQDGTTPDHYKMLRTWTAIDPAGNNNHYTQTIQVQDTIAPVFSRKPTDYEASCSAELTAPVVIAKDDCDNTTVDNIVVPVKEVKKEGECADSYTLERTWDVEDRSGNAETWTQTIVVSDDEAPEVQPTKTICLHAEGDSEQHTTFQGLDRLFTAQDNCDPSLSIAITSCNSTETVATPEWCRITTGASGGNLVIRAAAGAKSYTLHATVSDRCTRSTTTRQVFWVAPNAALAATFEADSGSTCHPAGSTVDLSTVAA